MAKNWISDLFASTIGAEAATGIAYAPEHEPAQAGDKKMRAGGTHRPNI